MKKGLIFSLIAMLAILSACEDEEEQAPVYDSVINPAIVLLTEGDIIAGETYVELDNASTATGTEIVRYFWHLGFSGEGNWTEDVVPIPFVFKSTGDYTITLTAWGADGNKASTTLDLSVYPSNVAPTADFTYSPASVMIGTLVTFTDTSTDEDGEIASRLWTFPDGSTADTETCTYTFTEEGLANVSLTVADDRGVEASVTKAIYVNSGEVSGFTVNWAVEVAGSDASCPASVVAVSELGYIYFTSDEGKIIALDPSGNKAWEYDAITNDGVVFSYVSYPSVDTDGTVYWAVVPGSSAGDASVVYAFDGMNGTALWKNTTAYGTGDRVSYSTPGITPDMVVIGNRGSNGRLRGFDKGTGRNSATQTPSNGGVNSAIAILKSGIVIMNISSNYGYGVMLPDDTFTWSAVPTSYSLTPNNILTANSTQICVGSDNMVYIVGSINTGSWNIGCFDCTTFDASTSKSPVWSKTLDAGFQYSGGALSADGQTLYVITDKESPYNLYALSTSTGNTKWSYSIDSQAKCVPAVDDLGQIHFCTTGGKYIVLQDNGSSYTELYNEQVATSIDGSPTISSVTGASYFVGLDSASGSLKVYSISLPGVGGPANSAWPMYGGNPAHNNYQK